MFDLTGHVSLVTGGNGGLGLAMAKGLMKANAKVVIWGRNEQKNAAALNELAALGGDAASVYCDVTDPEQVQAAFEATLSHFGQVDSCFANAGGAGHRGALHEIPLDQWYSNMDLNLTSVVHTFKPVISHLLSRGAPGKLVVTSSLAARMGMPMNSGYSTSKAAVLGLVQSLAVELGPSHIQVNAVLPGVIETEMVNNTPQFFRDSAKRRSVSGEIGKPEDMEGIAVFLASKESNFVTGQSIVVDGGQSIFPF